MSDLISRQDAIDTVEELNRKVNDGRENDTICTSDVLRRIKALQSAEPKTGDWIQKDMYADRFCSKCKYAVWDSEAEEYNFCPNCGAKMKGADDE